ncbi:MAG: hypothetical protein R2761_18625 [Acidimicrobiales bacterium]
MLDRDQGVEHTSGLARQVLEPQAVGEVGERPAPVGVDDVEDLAHRRGEADDPQRPVEEQRGDVGGREQVLEVAGQHAQLLHLVPVLLVEGGQLLVHRLELLFRGLQLLHGGTQLLVGRLQLLVGRLHLLLAGLVPLDDRLQPLAGQVELGLQLPHGAAPDPTVALHRLLRCVELVEHHEHETVDPVVEGGNGPHQHRALHPFHRQPYRTAAHRTLLAAGGVDRGPQLEAELVSGQPEHVGRRVAFGVGQVPARPGRGVDHPVLGVDQHAGRGVLLDQPGVHRPVPGVGPSAVHGGRDPGGVAAGAAGEGRHRRLAVGHVATAEDAVGLVHGAEELRPVERLGGAQHEMTAGVEGVVEDRDCVGLHVALEVDQQVPARDQAQTGERRILQQAVGGEHHHLPQLFTHPVAAVVADEEPAQAFGADVAFDRDRVHALPGPLQRRGVQVGGEQLKLGRLVDGVGVLGQQHGQAVGLLAGGAAHRPRPHAVLRALALEQPGDDVGGQRGEHLRVPEEAGDRDQEVVEQELHLVAVVPQQLHVGAQVRQLMELHTASDAAPHRGLLVAGHVVAGAGPDEGEDPLQELLGFGRCGGTIVEHGQAGLVPGDPHQPGRDLGHREHHVGHSGGDGAARHPVVLGLPRVLDHGQPAPGLDRGQAARAVAAGAAEHHADGVAVVGGGQGAEEVVDRAAVAALFLQVGQPEVGVDGRQVPSGRDHVHVAAGDRHRLGHLVNGHGGMGLEQVGQVAALIGGEVHHHHDRQAGVGR